MIAKKDYRRVQDQLQSFLARQLQDVSVQIGDDIYYRGTNIVVTSARFAGLLPEQRFYLVARAIPEDFYEEHLHGGCVWFELAPGETGKDLMRMPRSEDVAREEAKIRAMLEKAGFFDQLEAALAADAKAASAEDFTLSKRILAKAGLGDQDTTRACLYFILQGAYSDRQVLAGVAGAVDEDDE